MIRDDIWHRQPLLGATAYADTNSAPTVVGDAVCNIRTRTQYAGPRYLVIKGRVTGNSAAAVQIIPWLWDQDESLWHPMAPITMHPDADIEADTTGLVGNVYRIEADEGSSKLYLEVPNTAAADCVVTVVVRKGT